MPSSVRVERTRRNFVNESNRYDVKRDRIVRCARELGEQGNAAKVSVTDITDAIGITRGLFYYYFGGKDELHVAIADTYISDLSQAVNEAIAPLKDDRVEAMVAIASCVRAWTYREDGTPLPMRNVLNEIGLTGYVYNETSNMLAELLMESGFVNDYGKLGPEQLTRRVRLVMTGLVGEVFLRPEVSARELADTMCAALRFRRRRS